ncbi:MAG: ABC transporter substrate-binding protein [Acidimicrobiales bacterium]
MSAQEVHSVRRSLRAATTVAVTGTLVLAVGYGVSGAATGSSRQPTKSPITIALISSTTGVAGPQYQRAAEGFKARVALQNANGGIDGHQLNGIVINDAGNYTQEASIVQGAVQTKGAIGIVSDTPFMFEAYRWLQQNHIPVTGSSADGSEWGTPKNTNMFPSDDGYQTPNAPATAAFSTLMKKVGAKSVASLGYSISPLSSQAAKNYTAAAKHAGLKTPYLDTAVTFGATDFTSEALAVKKSGADLVTPTMDDNSNFALLQDLRNAGSKAKGLLATGLEPTAVGSSSWTALQGSYFFQVWVPTQLHTKATSTFQSALKTYENVPTSTFPDWSVYESWLGATLMIKGLLKDGSSPTSQGIIGKLRKVTNFNGNGLLSHPINYTALAKKKYGPTCIYYLKAEKSGFVPVNKTPICGTAIPGTGTKSATG